VSLQNKTQIKKIKYTSTIRSGSKRRSQKLGVRISFF